MKKLQAKRLALLAALTALSVNAFAAVPAEVTTAITTAKTDSETVASAVLVVIVGIFAFKLLRKAL